MKIIAPDYYKRFACRADACRHSCCIGWEIDIDPQKLAYYRSLTGNIGLRLKENICTDRETACFRLDGDERCPFLNRDGLCDLILELGEDSLCQICADHPRFRNFFSDRVEIGLGLCCEAAGDLILKNQESVGFVVLEDDGQADETDDFEQELLDLRAELIAIAQDRTLPLEKRMEALPDSVNLPRPAFSRQWYDFFLGLERLDPHWGELLAEAGEALPSPLSAPELETCFEQLLVYLLQRHLPGALEDDDIAGRILFAVLLTDLLQRLCGLWAQNRQDFCTDDLVELARMASSEIEYSDENIAAILARLHEEYPEI